MDDIKVTITTGKNDNEPPEYIKCLRRFQDLVLRSFNKFSNDPNQVVLRANNDDDDDDNPEIIALKREHRKLLGCIRKFLTLVVDVTDAEVAIVVLFQIMSRNTNATREGVGEEGGAAEMEVEVGEHTQKPSSVFEIVCILFGKEAAMEIVNDMLNNKTMNITTALGDVITGYRKGSVQRECMYYLLRKHQELTHMYRKLMENMIRGNTIELGLIAIFMQNKEDNNNSITTWFQTACHRLGRNIVDEIIEDILQQQQLAVSSSVLSRSSVNTMLALEHAAAINDNSNNKNHDQTHSVHVDGFYFLLRRQPDVLLRCSSSSSSNNSSTITSSIITSNSNSPTSPSEAGVAAATARDSSHTLADEGCTTSSTIRKRTRMEK